MGGILGFGSQRHQGIRALPRPLESTRVIDVSVGFSAQINQKSFGFARGGQPNPGPPSPFAGIFQLDPRKGSIVEPGQMFPVVNVFPNPLEGHRNPALVDRTQCQFSRHNAHSPSRTRRASALRPENFGLAFCLVFCLAFWPHPTRLAKPGSPWLPLDRPNLRRNPKG